MDNTQHTSGPLFSKGRFTSDSKETCANMHTVYDSKTNIIAVFDHKPDANLFATAPDLLSSLKSIASGFPYTGHLTAEHMHVALDAITKAEGK